MLENMFKSLFGTAISGFFDSSSFIKKDPVLHNYTKRGWGHDIIIRPDKDDHHKISGSGWGPWMNVGDYIIVGVLPDRSNTPNAPCYKLTEWKHCGDPDDMFHYKAEYISREKLPQELQERANAIAERYLSDFEREKKWISDYKRSQAELAWKHNNKNDKGELPIGYDESEMKNIYPSDLPDSKV